MWVMTVEVFIDRMCTRKVLMKRKKQVEKLKKDIEKFLNSEIQGLFDADSMDFTKG